MIEPTITINGRPLTEGQAMTVRCAIESFAAFLTENGLCDDERGVAMQAAYLARIRDILEIMGL